MHRMFVIGSFVCYVSYVCILCMYHMYVFYVCILECESEAHQPVTILICVLLFNKIPHDCVVVNTETLIKCQVMILVVSMAVWLDNCSLQHVEVKAILTLVNLYMVYRC